MGILLMSLFSSRLSPLAKILFTRHSNFLETFIALHPVIWFDFENWSFLMTVYLITRRITRGGAWNTDYHQFSDVCLIVSIPLNLDLFPRGENVIATSVGCDQLQTIGPKGERVFRRKANHYRHTFQACYFRGDRIQWWYNKFGSSGISSWLCIFWFDIFCNINSIVNYSMDVSADADYSLLIYSLD